MHTPRISVILPVYNVEAYLRDAMDSILGQTLTDLEVICVDDGSPDNSIQILQEYAASDTRVRILRQENQGLSMTRNNGVQLASGTWIYFMDSDDILEPDALEKATAYGTAHDLDMVCFHCSVFADSPEWETHAQEVYDHIYNARRPYPDVYTGYDYMRLLHEDNIFTNNVWLFILRRSFLQTAGLTFTPGVLMEDVKFHVHALLEAQRVGCINEPLYRYRIRSGSILTGQRSFRLCYGLYHAAVELWDCVDTGQLPEDIQEILTAKSTLLIQQAQENFALLSPEEKQKLNELPISTRIRIASICGASANHIADKFLLEQEFGKLSREHDNLCHAYIEIQTTLSYRLGRQLTFLPRKIKGILKK